MTIARSYFFLFQHKKSSSGKRNKKSILNRSRMNETSLPPVIEFRGSLQSARMEKNGIFPKTPGDEFFPMWLGRTLT
ncbi:hypothetical protein TNCV_5061941 [Trichonephila clavipes]|nr:hypothetical protein TNCV_5061941 [Trichonephila clavipes]